MIENLCIDSGGLYGYNYVGCIKYLYDQNLLNSLKNILGSSIGSIIGLFIVLKFSIDDIIIISKSIDFEKIIDLNNNNF